MPDGLATRTWSCRGCNRRSAQDARRFKMTQSAQRARTCRRAAIPRFRQHRTASFFFKREMDGCTRREKNPGSLIKYTAAGGAVESCAEKSRAAMRNSTISSGAELPKFEGVDAPSFACLPPFLEAHKLLARYTSRALEKFPLGPDDGALNASFPAQKCSRPSSVCSNHDGR